MEFSPIDAFIHEKRRIKQAAAFNELVEECLAHKPQVIIRFGQVMNEFAARRMDIPTTIQEILHLLHGYPHLLHDFNQFLPIEAQISVDECLKQIPFHYGPCTCDAPLPYQHIQPLPPHLAAENRYDPIRQPQNPNPANFADAEQFILTVKNQYEDRPQIYSMFVDVLRSFRKRELAVVDVYYQTKGLLHDTPDLFKEFLRFLPTDEHQIILDAAASER